MVEKIEWSRTATIRFKEITEDLTFYKQMRKRNIEKQEFNTSSNIVLIFTFIIGVILVLINTSQIPPGYEMGAIAFAFESYISGLLIFFAAVLIVNLSKKVIKGQQIFIFQIMVCSIALFLIYYITMQICIE